MTCKSCARNVEQLRRAPLIATCLLVNKSDVPFHGICQRKIGARLFVVIRERNRIRSFTRSRRLIGFEIGWKNDMLGKNDGAIAKQSHGADRITSPSKVSPALMMETLHNSFVVNRV